MNLQEILTKLVEKNANILLCDANKDWEAGELLLELSPPKLKTAAYFQPGMYIAEINTGGYLGQVLYKVKAKA